MLCFNVANMMAANPAAMSGATAHDAAICETLPFFHSHVIDAWDAKPTPMRAPTTVCVVDTGKPTVLAIASHVALPTSAQPIASMRAPGVSLNRSREMIPLLMVEVTRAPKATAPTNSVHAASIPAWGIVSVRAATEVAYEFATSFAPLPKALKTKAMVVKARIQSYLAVMDGAMTADLAKSIREVM